MWWNLTFMLIGFGGGWLSCINHFHLNVTCDLVACLEHFHF
jgi:hypothetical protein